MFYHVSLLSNHQCNSRQLQKEGCLTTLASNGLQALNKVKELAASDKPKKVFDVILVCHLTPASHPLLTNLNDIDGLRNAGHVSTHFLSFAKA